MSYSVKSTALKGVLILESQVYQDNRGNFFEGFNQKHFDAAIGYSVSFVQDNQSRSIRNVLRGLHYQIQNPQGKLIRVLDGLIYDVAVDLRKSSETFGRWVGVELSQLNRKQLWIPPGFAHGFVVISPSADVLYKTTDYWYPQHERNLLWNDPQLGIDWPIKDQPLLGSKDLAALPLDQCQLFE